MSKYINIGNAGFARATKDEYVDKTRLIAYVNRSLGTEHNMLCVTRARRFGKSMAAKMLNAYYDKSCDSRQLFANLQIAGDPSYEQHRNRYPVIYLDMTRFTTLCSKSLSRVVDVMTQEIVSDLMNVYPDVKISNPMDLPDVLLSIVEDTHETFVMIIDEWDAICRESRGGDDAIRLYVDWLRGLFKSNFSDRIFTGVYMTGILPVYQYDTQSALNNFCEFTMINPGPLAGFFGLNIKDVETLSAKYHVDVEVLRQWYDGYQIGDARGMFNPFSVVQSVANSCFKSYWVTTGAYESLRKYITMNFAGVKDAVLELMAGTPVKVNVLRFSNNLREVASRDAVLTALVHLGYLSYDGDTETVTIPNLEVWKEFEKTIADTGWEHVAAAIAKSESLLEETLRGDAEAVEKAVDAIHQDSASILQYNDENSLACTLSLAYYAAKKDFVLIWELPAGKGFADIVLLPRKGVDKPAILLELKWDKSAQTAISQILDKQYVGSLKDYFGEIVLVGINYDKKTKEHKCVIKNVLHNVLHGNKNVLHDERFLKIKELIEQDSHVTRRTMAQAVGVTEKTIGRWLKKDFSGYIHYVGSGNKGYWVVDPI